MRIMQITLLHVADCPNLDLARERLAVALAGSGVAATITDRLVTDAAEAAALGFAGSPTILIDGADPFATPDRSPSLACRLYPTGDGLQGAPTVDELVEALRRCRDQDAGDAPTMFSRLDGNDGQIRWVMFERLRHGRSASSVTVASDTELTLDEVEAALDRLAAAGLIERGDDDTIIGAYGLTLRPTVHELLLDGVELHTWCALDAIGIPAGLNGDATVVTRCRWCGRRLHVDLIAGRPVEGHAVVLWLPDTACGNVRQQFCPDANLFCDDDHVQRWHDDAGRPTGRSLTLAETAELGRRWWSTDSDCCPTPTKRRSP